MHHFISICISDFNLEVFKSGFKWGMTVLFIWAPICISIWKLKCWKANWDPKWYSWTLFRHVTRKIMYLTVVTQHGRRAWTVGDPPTTSSPSSMYRPAMRSSGQWQIRQNLWFAKARTTCLAMSAVQFALGRTARHLASDSHTMPWIASPAICIQSCSLPKLALPDLQLTYPNTFTWGSYLARNSIPNRTGDSLNLISRTRCLKLLVGK